MGTPQQAWWVNKNSLPMLLLAKNSAKSNIVFDVETHIVVTITTQVNKSTENLK